MRSVLITEVDVGCMILWVFVSCMHEVSVNHSGR